MLNHLEGSVTDPRPRLSGRATWGASLNAFRSILKSVASGYSDTFSGLWQLRRLFLTVLAIDFLIHEIWLLIFDRVGYSDLLIMGVVNIVMVASRVFVTTSLALAVHRYLRFGEIAGAYRMPPLTPRFRNYFASAVALIALGNIGFFLCLLGDSVSGPGLVVSELFAGLGLVLWVCMILLFPAIAIEDNAVGWGAAARDLRGQRWRTAVVLGLAMVPLLIATLAFGQICYGILSTVYRPIGYHALVLGGEATFILAWTLVVAVGTRLYQQRHVAEIF